MLEKGKNSLKKKRVNEEKRKKKCGKMKNELKKKVCKMKEEKSKRKGKVD